MRCLRLILDIAMSLFHLRGSWSWWCPIRYDTPWMKIAHEFLTYHTLLGWCSLSLLAKFQIRFISFFNVWLSTHLPLWPPVLMFKLVPIPHFDLSPPPINAWMLPQQIWYIKLAYSILIHVVWNDGVILPLFCQPLDNLNIQLL